MIRISINKDIINIHDFMFDVIMVIGVGGSSAVLVSKIMMMTAIRENHDENGSCVEFFGSNLHSNGDHFSWSSLFFLEIKVLELWPLVVGLFSNQVFHILLY